MDFAKGDHMNIQQFAREMELQQEECIEILRLFVENSYRDLDQLDSALAQKDMEKACEAAHSLKGAGVSLGLNAFSTSAQNIETEAKHGKISAESEDIRFLRTQLDEISASLFS
jgi:HPt (histidine-containing phosphotransfer) domain-containing protein